MIKNWKHGNISDRFWMQVNKTETCWQWAGFIRSDGYARFVPQGRRQTMLVHRWAYEQTYGPIPEGHTIDHTCHNGSGCAGGSCLHRSCVRPDHLEAVLLPKNILRGVSPSASHARKTTCPRGHPYDREYSGKRRCSLCLNQGSRARYAREHGRG